MPYKLEGEGNKGSSETTFPISSILKILLEK